MMFQVWEEDEEREDARTCKASDAAEAAELEAERRFEPADAFEDITLMVARRGEDPVRIVVDVEMHPEFWARR